MKEKLTSVLSLILAFLMVIGIGIPASAVETGEMKAQLAAWLPKNITVLQAENKIDSYLDWAVFAMARNGYTDYNDAYRAYIGGAVAQNKGSLFLNDFARIALAVMSVGMDARNTGGENLIETIEKSDFAGEAYTGSVAYALIAVDAAKSRNEAVRSTLKSILTASQREDGGFNAYLAADESAYWTVDGETDTTGIVLQALAPYKEETEIREAIGKAIAFIKKEQMDDGGFGAWGTGSAESTAMILCGLCAIGENPDSFVKNGKTIADALSAYINTDGGGRCWDGTSNIMTTYQMLMGISAYERYRSGQIGLFDMRCLSPACNSIEHFAIFEKLPALGRFICHMVSMLCLLLKIPYYCCRH